MQASMDEMREDSVTQRCGYCALLGRPNAGKSTLLNALLGQKIAGVSAKAQTTRNRIVGVDTVDREHQILFLDTPGLHRSKKTMRLNSSMNKEAWSVVSEANILCYLVDLRVGLSEQDVDYINQIRDSFSGPVLLLGTKHDSMKKALARAAMRQLHEDVQTHGWSFTKVQAFSSKRPEDVAKVRKYLATLLPVGPFLFAEDELSDRSSRFLASELIREQLFRCLGDELPYGAGVVVESFEENSVPLRIGAVIMLSEVRHKGMVIGRAGQMIKKVGTQARQSLEQLFDSKVHLELFVRVEENWIEKPALIEAIQDLQ